MTSLLDRILHWEHCPGARERRAAEQAQALSRQWLAEAQERGKRVDAVTRRVDKQLRQNNFGADVADALGAVRKRPNGGGGPSWLSWR